MLKRLLICCCIPLGLQAQAIDTTVIREAEKVLGLSFTAAERDSMQDRLRGSRANYERMRKQPTPNSLPNTLAFNPRPHGMKIPLQQGPVQFALPAVSLPANREDLAWYSLPQLASLIKNRKISSVELTRFFLDRLKKWGDTLECVITLTEELAMKEARQADEELKKGLYRGWLHGIPYGLKDLFAVKGYKTTWGSVPYKDQVIEEDAFVYTQLRKAGAVLCAKLTLGELAYADLWFGGRTRNPWNLKTGSSGSSAGSAAAVVAGLLPYAIGTETLGSIVSPSHTCGATGLRPTFGSVSRSGAMVLCWSLDKAGPICRSAEDAAIVFQYLKGTDGKDASATERAFNYKPLKDPRKLRIAVAANYFRNVPKNAPQWAVLDSLRRLGATIQEVNFPDSAIYPFNIVDIVLNAESSAAFDELTRSNQDDLIRRQDKSFWPNSFRAGRFVPAVEYINANRHRYTLIEKMNRFMQDWDVVIVPTYAGSQLGITNLTGHPVVCFPVGFSANGLPTSITFIGNLYEEHKILALAQLFQDKTDWNRKHPELFLK